MSSHNCPNSTEPGRECGDGAERKHLWLTRYSISFLLSEPKAGLC